MEQQHKSSAERDLSAKFAPRSAGAQPRQGLRRYIGPKRTLILVGFVAIVATAWYLRTQGLLNPSFIQNLIDDHPVSAAVLFVLLFALAVLSTLPSLPINLAAGMFWGPIAGAVLSTLGATLGAVAAFAVARSVLGQPLARHFDNRIIAEIQREFEAKGWWFLAFLRLNPIFPTGLLNYIFGLTAIDLFSFTWVTFVFLLPPSLVIAYIGHRVGTFVIDRDIASSVQTILAVSAGITVLAALGYGARLFNRLHSAAGPQNPQDPR